ncbi:hypothetical protein F53441_3950 [Fusarium austroafricanum]|uniref:Uncharacterized protein n=1 Tax=Fusarium austroafricanum TaxID=2364996 RepID=A0A8H4KPT1_9HYPO|nr:hypothetical protein F53441_3950 [Fusarium austroafricanum]
MPNFSRLIFIARVLTCVCCRRRNKCQKSSTSNQPYMTEHSPRRNASEFEVSDRSQYSSFSQLTPGCRDLPHPDEFEVANGRDEFGLNPPASGRFSKPAFAAPMSPIRVSSSTSRMFHYEYPPPGGTLESFVEGPVSFASAKDDISKYDPFEGATYRKAPISPVAAGCPFTPVSPAPFAAYNTSCVPAHPRPVKITWPEPERTFAAGRPLTSSSAALVAATTKSDPVGPDPTGAGSVQASARPESIAAIATKAEYDEINLTESDPSAKTDSAPSDKAKPGPTKPGFVEATATGAVHTRPAEDVPLPASPTVGTVTSDPTKSEPVEATSAETNSDEVRSGAAGSAAEEGKASD